MSADPHSLGEVVVTADGSSTLKHPEHGECYHSSQGAAFEAQALYIDASGFKVSLPQMQRVSVLDVGLGLGYNAMATLAAWSAGDSRTDLALTSLEINPNLVEALASGHAPWQEAWPDAWKHWSLSLKPTSSGQWHAAIAHPHGQAVAHWQILTGDALAQDFKDLAGTPFNFIWQDPFSPLKNPRLWSAEWFTKVREAAAPNAVLMTYSVARVVRDALDAADWQWQKLSAQGHAKRHWLRATAARQA